MPSAQSLLRLLCRTSPVDGDRHNGLSQFLVPLDTPGIVRTPIKFLDGSDDFCEVVMTDAYMGDECLLGEAGMGWHQVTSELAARHRPV